jgi:hypothetical protein
MSASTEVYDTSSIDQLASHPVGWWEGLRLIARAYRRMRIQCRTLSKTRLNGQLTERLPQQRRERHGGQDDRLCATRSTVEEKFRYRASGLAERPGRLP